MPLPPPAPIIPWHTGLKNRICEPITKFDEDLSKLADTLIATCYSSNALGVAAPQIGVFSRVVVVHVPQEEPAVVMVNLEIDEINSKGEQTGAEGCLSLPCESTSGRQMPIAVRVRRALDVVYSYQDLTGKRIQAKATGLKARAIQHERDHLDGIFYIDRIGDVTRNMVIRSFRNFLSNHPQIKS